MCTCACMSCRGCCPIIVCICVFLLKCVLAAVCLCVHDIERGKERGGEKD